MSKRFDTDSRAFFRSGYEDVPPWDPREPQPTSTWVAAPAILACIERLA